jgi:hypothetical protein
MQNSTSGCDGAEARLGHNHIVPAGWRKLFGLSLFPSSARFIDLFSLASITADVGECAASQRAWRRQIFPVAKRVQFLLTILSHSAQRIASGGALARNRNKWMALSPLLAAKLNGELLPG